MVTAFATQALIGQDALAVHIGGGLGAVPPLGPDRGRQTPEERSVVIGLEAVVGGVGGAVGRARQLLVDLLHGVEDGRVRAAARAVLGAVVVAGVAVAVELAVALGLRSVFERVNAR